jgi:glycosyltransferase involved in cell wall biosynthesis
VAIANIRSQRMDSGRLPRILYLSLEAPREGVASFVHVTEIIEGLRRHGWSVDLIAPRYSGAWVRPSLFGRLLEYVRMELGVLTRLPQSDLIYIRNHFLALPVALGAWLLRRPVIHEVNGPYTDAFVTYAGARPFRRFLSWMQRLQYRKASGLIAVTSGLADWLKKQGGRCPIATISNGANIELFRPGAIARIQLPKPYAVFVGGLARWHGVPTMLSAAQDPAWPAGVHLVIVGDGQERGMVDEAVARCSHIVGVGRIPYAEVPGIIAGSLCALVPISDPGGRSQTGLAPIKLFEALACGKPVIVSDLPGLAEPVETAGCGKVFPSGNSEALATAVADLAAFPETADEMGRRGLQWVLAAHSWEHRARQTDLFLRQFLSRTETAAAKT